MKGVKKYVGEEIIGGEVIGGWRKSAAAGVSIS
jgi:hypothetical protein